MRSFALAKQTDGINRLRTKGGASDSALYDLVNGWVSAKGTINCRDGTRKKLQFPPGTIGAFGHQGVIHTFSAHAVANSDARIAVDILWHPTGGAAALSKIHNVFPVLGRLYVVAEFADGVVKHYWIDLPAAWTANAVLAYGVRVSPTAGKGLYYRATNASTAPAWTPSTTTALNKVVQPTVVNGFTYIAIDVQGNPVRTSNTEPTWPTTDGATVTERRYFTEPGVGGGSSTPPTPSSPSGSPGDYGPYPPSGNTNHSSSQL